MFLANIYLRKKWFKLTINYWYCYLWCLHTKSMTSKSFKPILAPPFLWSHLLIISPSPPSSTCPFHFCSICLILLQSINSHITPSSYNSRFPSIHFSLHPFIPLTFLSFLPPPTLIIAHYIHLLLFLVSFSCSTPSSSYPTPPILKGFLSSQIRAVS